MVRRYLLVIMMVCVGQACVGYADERCPGDCNADNQVEVNEIVQAVAIALGNAGVTACPIYDSA